MGSDWAVAPGVGWEAVAAAVNWGREAEAGLGWAVEAAEAEEAE